MSGIIKIVYGDTGNFDEIQEKDLQFVLLKADESQQLIQDALQPDVTPEEQPIDMDTNFLSEDENSQIYQTPRLEKKARGLLSEWNIKETNFLMKRYNKYITKIGHNQLFKTKRDMWQQISQDMSTLLGATKSHCQCENRYKTLLRRWKRNNNSCDNAILTSPQSDSAETKDDCPKAVSNSPTRTTTGHESEIVSTMWKIFHLKEEAKERRHREKMELLRKIVNNKKL